MSEQSFETGSQRFKNDEEFRNVNPALAVLVSRHERLRLAQPRRQISLRDPGARSGRGEALAYNPLFRPNLLSLLRGALGPAIRAAVPPHIRSGTRPVQA